MKRNAHAAAHAPATGKQKKPAAKPLVKKTVNAASKKMENVDEILTPEDRELIKNIDARLHDLYYLNDEEDFIGYC